MRLGVLGLVAGLSLTAGQTLGQDLTLTVAGDNTVRDDLRRASLVVTTLDENGSPQDIIAAARADYRRMITALYAAGYYAGSVSIRVDGIEAANLAALDAPSSIQTIAISVTTGPQFQFGQAAVSPVTATTTLPDGFEVGGIAQSGLIKEAATAAIDGWRQEGHALAAVSGQQITARHADSELNVAIDVEPGPVLRFADLQVQGNSDVNTARIVRIAGLGKGQFSPDDLDRAVDRLLRTGAFSGVRMIENETANEDGTLTVTAQVVERAPRRLGYGAEFSNVDGLTLSGFWLHRNFLGGAERFRLGAEMSGIDGGTGGIDYETTLDFSYPRPLAVDTELNINLTLSHEQEPTYTLDQASGEVTLDRLIGTDVTIGGGLGFARARLEDGFGTRDYSIVTAPIYGEVDRRDEALDPNSGFFASAEVTPFLGFGDVGSGGRATFDGRAYYSLEAENALTFAARGQLGTLFGVGVDQAPGDFLFYSGGGDTVRGQSYQSLGIETGGVTTGGLSFAAISLEARYDLSDSIGVVGFYNTGFVGETPTPFSDGAWHDGVGLGLRYKTGIGPIRLDLATPATGDDAFSSLSLYIGIGQSF